MLIDVNQYNRYELAPIRLEQYAQTTKNSKEVKEGSCAVSGSLKKHPEKSHGGCSGRLKSPETRVIL